ncbi:MAG: hypothetical protein EBT91_10710, partial [Rhodobacteraceae bacterium]|nr:hypothetical protein [Paracoccaceae bacterium]
AGENFRPLVEEIVLRWKAARERKDWAEADRIRTGLEVAGVDVKNDKDGGVTYKRAGRINPAKLEALK